MSKKIYTNPLSQKASLLAKTLLFLLMMFLFSATVFATPVIDDSGFNLAEISVNAGGGGYIVQPLFNVTFQELCVPSYVDATTAYLKEDNGGTTLETSSLSSGCASFNTSLDAGTNYTIYVDSGGVTTYTRGYEGAVTYPTTATNVKFMKGWHNGLFTTQDNALNIENVTTEVFVASTFYPLLLENVSASSITNETSLITWNTNVSANSTVDFGVVSGSLNLSNSSASLVTDHSIYLYGLESNTTYYYTVSSYVNDSSYNVSAEYSFSTLETEVNTSTINILYPSVGVVQQLNNLSHGDIWIYGSYTGNIDSLEARFDGGSWDSLNATISGGVFSGWLHNQALSQGLLEVRDSNITQEGNDSVANIGLGDVYVVIGSSQIYNTYEFNEEAGHTYSSNVFSMSRIWEGSANGDNFLNGSVWSGIGMFSQMINYLQNTSYERPTGWIMWGISGSTMPSWNEGSTNYNNMITSVTQATNGTMRIKSVVGGLGLADMHTGNLLTYDQAYENVTGIADSLANDLNVLSDVPLVVHAPNREVSASASSVDNVVRAFIDAGIYNTTNVSVGLFTYDIDIYDNTGDGVHIIDLDDVSLLAERWFAGLNYYFYGGENIFALINDSRYMSSLLNMTFTEPVQPSSGSKGYSFSGSGGSSLDDTDVVSAVAINETVVLNVTGLNESYNVTYGSFLDAYGTTNLYFNSSLFLLPVVPFYNYYIDLFLYNSVTIYAYAVNGSALTGYSVQIYNSNETYSGSESGGSIYFTDLVVGDYTVVVSKSGYQNAEYSLSVSFGSHQTVNAYLDNLTTTTVDFTTINSISGAVIEGATINQYRTVGGNWTLVNSKLTDLTGRSRFDYSEDIEYRFDFIASGYENRIVYLEPLFSTYTVPLTPDIESVHDVNVGDWVYLINNSGNFFDDQINNFSITISSGTGTLEYYYLNVTNVDDSVTQVSCSVAYGCTHDFSLNISADDFTEVVIVEFWIKEVDQSEKYFKKNYVVQDIYNPSTLWGWKDVDDSDVGDLEKAFFAMIITLIVVGVVATASVMIGVPPITPSGFVLGATVEILALVGFIPSFSAHMIALGCILIILFGRGEI